MVGKKNIVFGFAFLVLTASLGPYMLTQLAPKIGAANGEKSQALGALQTMIIAKFKDEIEEKEMTAAQVGDLAGKAILAIDKVTKTERPRDLVKGGPHAHGNLESMLNIVVGIMLCFLAAPMLIRQLISWLFIIGTVMHSGILLLTFIPELGMSSWAGVVLGYGIGPIMILAALMLSAVASFIWLRTEVVQD